MLFTQIVDTSFDVVVVDDRDVYANRDRFPGAREVYAGDMDEMMAQLNHPTLRIS